MEESCCNHATLLSLSWEYVVFPDILPFLSIKDCFNLRSTSRGYKFMIDEYFSRLRSIDLSHQRHFTPLAFQVLCSGITNLRHLNLSNCNWLKDDLLIHIFNNNKHLLSVNLNSCTVISTACLQPLIINCKELKRLKLKNCHWVTRGCIEALTLHQDKIEVIDLTSCWDLGDSVIIPFLAKFTKLTDLNLSNIYSITDQTLNTIAIYNKDLVCLHLKGCWRITDDGLSMVGEYCRKLKVLHVEECRNISGRCLEPLRHRMYINREARPQFPGIPLMNIPGYIPIQPRNMQV